MGSLDVDSRFINILLDETINISTELIYDQNDSTEDLNKFEFQELLSLATKELYLIFNEILHKKNRCCSYELTIRTHSCLCFYEKKWLD